MMRINIKMAQNNAYAKKYENILYSQVFMCSFSDWVGVSWKTLGRMLNIEEHYLSMIDEDNPKTGAKAYSMLTTWMQMSDNPTFEELKTALRNMKRIDLIRKIDKFTKTPGSPEITSRFSANKETPSSPEITSRFSANKGNYVSFNYFKFSLFQNLYDL
ncbi:uncharacterized protein LOC136075810 [Hydra vulgaris]|uniref:Uncharacterized protein LOC136075810 n=1 Tax=Hydra vulgaris TaxID=6087 RepID=A0ABM4B8V7_HYDVU